MTHDMMRDCDREAFEGEVGRVTDGLQGTDVKLYPLPTVPRFCLLLEIDGEIEGMTFYTFLHCSCCSFRFVLGKKTQE